MRSVAKKIIAIEIYYWKWEQNPKHVHQLKSFFDIIIYRSLSHCLLIPYLCEKNSTVKYMYLNNNVLQNSILWIILIKYEHSLSKVSSKLYVAYQDGSLGDVISKYQ